MYSLFLCSNCHSRLCEKLHSKKTGYRWKHRYPVFFCPDKAWCGFIRFYALYLFVRNIGNERIGLIFVLSTLALCLLSVPFIGVAGFHAGFLIGFFLHHVFLS